MKILDLDSKNQSVRKFLILLAKSFENGQKLQKKKKKKKKNGYTEELVDEEGDDVVRI